MRRAIWSVLFLAWSAHATVPPPARSLPSPLVQAMAQGHLRAAEGADGTLTKGPLFTLGGIEVASGPGLTADQLGISAFAGEPVSARNLQAIGDAVRTYLLDHGHPFAVVSIDFSARAGMPVADLRIDIEAGDGFKHGGLRHSGSRTKPETLDRLSLLRYGETYSEKRLRLAAERLSRTGYFASVVPGPIYRDSTRNLLYPSLALADLQGNRLSGILGYDSEGGRGEGLEGFLDIRLINLRGTARDLDFTFDSKRTGQGTGAKEARLAYTEPWVLGTRVGARADLRVAIEDSVYDERSAEISLFQDLDFRSRYQISFARQTNRDFASGAGSDADIAGLGFRFDARDRAPGTMKGALYSLRFNGVRRELADSSYYLLQSIGEFSLWGNAGRWVGLGQVSGSGNWPLRRDPNRGELHSLGGSNTLRGFREREFLTDLFVYGNFEAQFLLAPGSRASLFVAPALINRLGGGVDWRRKMGYGAGLESGARDWTFGISYALNPDRGIGDGFVHLRVVNNF